MKIGMILRRPEPDDNGPLIAETIRLLLERDAVVEVICPQESPVDLSKLQLRHDIYVLKYTTEAELSLAGALHILGARIINPYPVSEMLRNKVVAAKALVAAGVVVPDTYMTNRVEHLAPFLQNGPLVVKPYRGSKGRGIRIIESRAELMSITTNLGPFLAQRYVKPDGRDKKIYSIGSRLFGVKRVWPARTLEEKMGEPFAITPELKNITLKCARAFGIDLFGIDIVSSGGKPYVVDASSFPGFKGVPEAAAHLADYIHTAGTHAIQGRRIPPEGERS